jgi:hypothetical protein
MTAELQSQTARPSRTRSTWRVLAVLLLASAGNAWAQAAVPYASGGVGENSQEELTARQGVFSLKLVFAEQQTGSYLADVTVTIVDAAGETLINALSDGPWFYTKLPAGDYKVTAVYRGVPQSVEVKVPATGLKEQVLRWAPAGEAK